MSQYNVSQLKDLRNRPVVDGKPILYRDHEAWRNDVELRVAALNDFMQARGSSFAGTTAPATIGGQIWADTNNSGRVVWTGANSAAGFNEEIASRLEAWRKSYSTAGGAAQITIGGKIVVDVTGGSAASVVSTVPANTLNTDAQAISGMAQGTATGSGVARVRFGAATICETALGTEEILGRGLAIRTGASAFKFFGWQKRASDATGATTHAEYAAGTDALASNQEFRFGSTYTVNVQQVAVLH